MKITEQRDTMREAIERCVKAIQHLRAHCDHKIGMPDGDGHCSNLLNYNTDIAPALIDIQLDLVTALTDTSR